MPTAYGDPHHLAMRQSATADHEEQPDRAKGSRATPSNHDKRSAQMPNWDEPRGRPGPFRSDHERDAWRREARGHLPERRSFDDGRYGGRGPLERQSPEMSERNRYA